MFFIKSLFKAGARAAARPRLYGALRTEPASHASICWPVGIYSPCRAPSSRRNYRIRRPLTSLKEGPIAPSLFDQLTDATEFKQTAIIARPAQSNLLHAPRKRASPICDDIFLKRYFCDGMRSCQYASDHET